MKLADRIAVVTGAAKGMGRDICLTLAREGANLAIAAREPAPLEALAREITALGRRALVVPTDVTDEPAVERLMARARETFGRIDILINAAGVTGPIETPVWEIKADDFDQVIAVNLRGTFLPTKHVLPGMIEQRYGKIVNISGTSGLRGYKYRAAYSSSKWALRGFTRTVALEAGPHNINVNALHPGIVGGDRMAKLCREKAKKRGWTPERVYQEYVDEMALRRVTVAQDIANAVLFLVSDDSRQHDGAIGHGRRRLGRLTPPGGPMNTVESPARLVRVARRRHPLARRLRPGPAAAGRPLRRRARWISSRPRRSSAPSVTRGRSPRAARSAWGPSSSRWIPRRSRRCGSTPPTRSSRSPRA